MTARIVTIYQNLVQVISAAFPNRQRVWNPYEIELAPSGVLENGWAITMGPASEPNRLQSCKIMPLRSIAITLTAAVPSDNDPALRVGIEQQILEDQLTLLKALEANSDLVGQANYQSDNGIEFLSIPDAAGRYLVLLTEFALTYEESLT